MEVGGEGDYIPVATLSPPSWSKYCLNRYIFKASFELKAAREKL